MTRIAFDIDSTLIKKTRQGDVPNYPVINLLLFFVENGDRVFVWSGGGEEYAQRWVEKLGLPEEVRVIGKSESFDIDIAFDDEEIELAKVNVRV